MPRFEYQARDASGTSLTGAITAPSAADASRLLRADGKFVTRILEAADAVDAATTISFGGKRVKEQDVIIFASQMAVMVDTGVPLPNHCAG
jgi:type IV pilus assembly protein PilC